MHPSVTHCFSPLPPLTLTTITALPSAPPSFPSFSHPLSLTLLSLSPSELGLAHSLLSPTSGSHSHICHYTSIPSLTLSTVTVLPSLTPSHPHCDPHQKEQYGLSFITLRSPPEDSSSHQEQKTTPTQPTLGAFSLKEEPKTLPTGMAVIAWN